MTVTVDQTNQNFLKVYVKEYCKAITKNYRDYHNDRGYTPRENLMKFEVRIGRNYYKVVQCEYDEQMGEYIDIVFVMKKIFVSYLIQEILIGQVGTYT